MATTGSPATSAKKSWRSVLRLRAAGVSGTACASPDSAIAKPRQARPRTLFRWTTSTPSSDGPRLPVWSLEPMASESPFSIPEHGQGVGRALCRRLTRSQKPKNEPRRFRASYLTKLLACRARGINGLVRAADSSSDGARPRCRMGHPAACQRPLTGRQKGQTTPWSIIASATLTKPAMFAPCT